MNNLRYFFIGLILFVFLCLIGAIDQYNSNIISFSVNGFNSQAVIYFSIISILSVIMCISIYRGSKEKKKK